MSQADTQNASNGFSVVEVTEATREKLLSEAREWAKELGSLRGSIENGDGNVAGRFAELVFTQVYDCTLRGEYDYDVWYNGLTIDLKTKRRTVAPKPHYEASISDFNTHQSCDVYFFTSLLGEDSVNPYSKIWFCGYLPKEEYFTHAIYHEEGEKDPDNGFTFKDDCYNLPYSEMRTPSKPQSLTI